MRYLSLFSGMEAASLAWAPLGWRCVGVAEVDPAACHVLAHRLHASRPKYMPDPDAPGITAKDREARLQAIRTVAHLPAYGTPGTLPNLGDVSQVTDDDIAALGPFDVQIGGSPCQDLSVAGKRAGLGGMRSSLFHHQNRIFNAARHFCGARWHVWENVPGAFSSNAGRDFAVVVGALAGCDLAVPSDGWGSEGVALGDAGLVEWSVLDAQWFGVAQRRRRVFAVLDTGNWTDRPPILLERDSLRGNSAPRREARQSVAGTLAGGARRSGGYSTDDVPLIAMAHGQGGAEVAYDRAPTLTCNHEAPIVAGMPEVAHTLRAEGFDASEDGTGRGTPLIPVPFDTTQITSPDNRSTPKAGDPCHPLAASAHPPAIAFGCKDSDPARSVSDDISPTLRAMGHAGSHANAGGQVAVAFQGAGSSLTVGDVSGTLRTNGHTAAGAAPMAQLGTQVRRLTPRECERLQGAPDDWTLVPMGKKRKPMADGPRYKMLGNSFAVPVIHHLGRQIQRAHRLNMEAA